MGTRGKLLVGLAVGGVLLVAKVELAFAVLFLPVLLDVANVVAALGALVALAVVARGRAPLGTVSAVTLALAVPTLDVVVAPAIGQWLVRDAEAYCEAASAGAPRGRAVPVLLRPGYSVRYAPRCDAEGGSFPDPFPGRVSWEGARNADGTWTWQPMMD